MSARLVVGLRLSLVSAIALLIASSHAVASRRPAKPAPPPSRYKYTLAFDLKKLPPGVTITEVNTDLGNGQKPIRHFIRNTSDKPLIVNERFQNDQLVTAAKLVSGKVYHYFPNGVPMEGKTHLKGWQAPFGEIKETLIYLPTEPLKIYEGRKPGLSTQLPLDEPFAIPAKYDGKPYSITGTIRYQLNPDYDTRKPKPDGK